MSTKDVAAFFDRRPCNSRHSPAPVGTDAYFEAVRERKAFVEPHLLAFMEPWKYRGKRVLDVGCGMGISTYWWVAGGLDAVGIDVSYESLRLAYQQLQELPLRYVFSMLDAQELGIMEWGYPFDIVFAWGSLHHMPSPARALNALRYQVDPGAELKVMLYHRRSWKALGLWLKHGSGWREFTEAQAGCPIAHAYTKAEAIELIESSAPWKVESIEVAHIFPYRVKDYREYRYVKAFPWNVCPGWLFRWLERRIGWHLLIRARAI